LESLIQQIIGVDKDNLPLTLLDFFDKRVGVWWVLNILIKFEDSIFNVLASMLDEAFIGDYICQALNMIIHPILFLQ
jgi:hypothetical protein